MTPYKIRSKPTEAWVSDPVTPENRAEVLAWIQRWGGRGTLGPDGYETAIVVHTLSGEADVLYGDRVVYNTADFYPINPEVFETRWEIVDG